MTIKEIAAKAGVSIATVSHVINHTRYVSPELVDKIEAIIEESGYSEKIKKKVRKIRSGRSSQIVAVFPNIKSALYCDLCNQLQSYATSQGYQFYTAVTNDSPEEEKSILQNLISSAKTIGIFLSPASSNPAAYAFLYESGIPFVCVERFIDDDVTPRILFDYTKAFHSATSYFFESGHENVLFLVEKTDSLAKQDKIAGYERARVYLDNGIFKALRIQRKLAVAAALDAHRLDNIQRCGTKHLVFLIRQRHSRCDNNGVAGVDADRVKVFHRADRNLVADGIAHYLKLDLLPSGNTFLNQNLIDR